MQVNLYTTAGCHLCEQARELLIALLAEGFEFELSEVEIANSDALIASYGIRIPVIAVDNTAELGWPFGREELATFLNEQR